jgi:putative protease
MGKQIGIVDQIGENFITIKTKEKLNNGDGLCFINKNELIGLRVEKAINNKVFVKNTSHLFNGIVLYRNHDHEFNKMLEADKSIRKVAANIEITEIEKTLQFELRDEDNLRSTYFVKQLPEVANDPELSEKNLIAQLSKSGNSMFQIVEVKNKCSKKYFFRISELNEIRRILFEKHEKYRIEFFARTNNNIKWGIKTFPREEVDFSENISNKLSEQFYGERGVTKIKHALEVSPIPDDQLLMTTRYCIKYELGYCKKLQKAKNTPPEPLFLEDQNRKYLLKFDCKNCMMQVLLHNNISKI